MMMMLWLHAATEEDSRANVKQRRELLRAQLNNCRKDKLKRKLPVDTQLLTCAKEDLSLKKKLVDQMDNMDTLHNEHMQKLSSNMEKLTVRSPVDFHYCKAYFTISATSSTNVSANIQVNKVEYRLVLTTIMIVHRKPLA